MVVDYAETRAVELAGLLPRLAACASAGEPVRVLLLVRASRREDWTAPLRNVSDGLDTLVDEMSLEVLDEAPLGPLPAPMVLAAAAVAASLLDRHRPAIAWAAAAGLAPVAGAATTVVLRTTGSGAGTGVLTELGIAGGAAAVLAVTSSVAAAAVLGREAARRHDLALVALAGACLTTGGATTWANASPPREITFLAGPALFLLVQAVAMLCQRDVFWRRPARGVALCAEVVAAVVATPLAAGFLVVAPFVDGGLDVLSDGDAWTPEPAAGLAWALLAGGWLLAAWRRQGPQASPIAALRGAVVDVRTVAFLAAATGAALVVGTGSTVATAAGLLVLGAVLVLAVAGHDRSQAIAPTAGSSGAAAATVFAAAAVLWAPLRCLPKQPAGIAAAGAGRRRGARWGRAGLGPRRRGLGRGRAGRVR